MSNEYDCPHCGAEDVGMMGHNCPESKENERRLALGEKQVLVETRFSRKAHCPDCGKEFWA